MTFSWGRTALIGFGFFGISVIWSLYNAYIPVFLRESFGLSASLIGGVMTIDNLLAILLLPYLGALSDRTRTRLGRRRPYLVFGVPIAATFFVLIPWAATSGSLGLMMSVLVGLNLAMSSFRSPVIALMPDVTPSAYRSQANGVINLMGGLGSLLAYFGGKALYDRDPGLAFGAGAFLLVLGAALVVIFVKETLLPRVSDGSEGAVSFAASMRELFGNLKAVVSGELSLLFVLLATLLWSVGFNGIETFFTSYAKYHLGFSESTGAMILGFFALAFMAAAVPAGMLGAKLGRRRTIYLGLIGMMGVVFSAWFVTSLPVISAVFALGGVSWACINVNVLPMVLDMAPQDKVGGYTGLYYFSSQAASILAPPMAGLLIDGFGYSSLMGFCGAFFVFAGASMLKVRRGEASAT